MAISYVPGMLYKRFTAEDPIPEEKIKTTEELVGQLPVDPELIANTLTTQEQGMFDPEGSSYDYETAKKFNLGPDDTGHYPSRVPETGQILKGRSHETWGLTEEEEQKQGYAISKGEDGRYYSQLVEQEKDKGSYEPGMLYKTYKGTKDVAGAVVGGFRGFAEESRERYPNDFINVLLYLADAVEGTAFIDTTKQFIKGIQLSMDEYEPSFQRGELSSMSAPPPGYMPPLWGDDYYTMQSKQLIANKEKYENDPEYKAKVDGDLESLRNEYEKEVAPIRKRIEQQKDDANLGEYGRSASSGIESLYVIGMGAGLTTITKGKAAPLVTPGVLSFFGMQTFGLSYGEGAANGLPPAENRVFAGLDSLSEVGTELLPVMRFLKPLPQKRFTQIFKEGIYNTALEVGTEELNMVIQEHNRVWFDLQTELNEAYKNANNPLYEGRTPGEILLDQAGHTALAAGITAGTVTATRTGLVVFSPTVKKMINDIEGTPEQKQELIKNIETTAKNAEVNFQAIDEAASEFLDPEFKNTRGQTVESVLAESFAKANFIRTDEDLAVKEARAEEVGPGMDWAEAQDTITELKNQYKGTADINFNVTRDPELGPEAGFTEATKAAYDPNQNTFFFFSDRISDRQDLERIFQHEVIGHYGIQKLLNNEDFNLVLDQVNASREENQQFKEIYDRVALNYEGQGEGVIAEEVIAKLAETTDVDSSLQSIIDKIYAIIAKALRSVGLSKTEITPSEVKVLLREAAQTIKEPTETTETLPGETRERRLGTTGQYVGAPKGLDTPQKLGALRKSLSGLAQEGEQGKYWYEQSGKAILDITQGNREDADMLAQAIAITSPGTPVQGNLNYAVQAYYQNKSGLPIETGRFPSSMIAKLKQAFAGQEWEGKKTDAFYANLMREIDTTKEQGVTIDLWMMRALGYDTESPGEAQYRFAEGEVNKLAERLGWEPQQVQASIWTAQKVKQEGLAPEEAKFDYSDAVNNQLAQISWESIPGSTTNHMPEMFNAEYQVLQDYHVQISKALLNENGTDTIAQRLGLLSPGFFEAPGFFEGKTSPGAQTLTVVPKKYKATKEEYAEVEPAAENLMKAYSAAVGILLKQNGIGYHKAFWQKNIAKGKLNGMLIDIGRTLSPEETAAVAQAMEEASGIKGEYNPIAVPGKGASLINFSYLGVPNLKFKKFVIDALDKVQFDNNESVNAGHFAASEGYLGNNWETDTNGESYLQSIRELPSDIQATVLDIIKELNPRIQEVENTFSEKYGWTQNQSLNQNYTEAPPLDEAVRFAKEEPETTDPEWNIDDRNFIDSILNTTKLWYVSALDPVLRAEIAIQKSTGKPLPIDLRPTRKESTRHGRTESQILITHANLHKMFRDMTNRKGVIKTVKELVVDPVDTIQKLLKKKKGIGVEEYNEFVYNLHAPERNAYINTLREPGKPGSVKYKDQGSGITTDEAIKYLKGVGVVFNKDKGNKYWGTARGTFKKGKDLLDIYEKYHKPIIEKTRKIYEDSGLIDKETLADWNGRYNYYVPLVGFALDTLEEGQAPRREGGAPRASGMTVVGQEIQKAGGRISKADGPLHQTVVQQVEAIMRAEKNRVMLAFGKMARQHPNTKAFEVLEDPPQVKPKSITWDPIDQRAFAGFKEGGKQKYLVIKNERMAKGLESLDVNSLGPIAAAAGKFTRFFSLINTAYDPAFMVTNFEKDYQTALGSILGEEGLMDSRTLVLEPGVEYTMEEMTAKVAETKSIFTEMIRPVKILRNTVALARWEITGKVPQDPYNKLSEEELSKEERMLSDFKLYGGETGWIKKPTVDSITADLEYISNAYKKPVITAPKKLLKSVLNVVEGSNNVIENVIRYTAFKAMVESHGGIDVASRVVKESAADLGKTLTINFNKRGTKSAGVSALYAFFNPQIQGNVALLRGLVGSQGISKKKWGLAGAYAGVGSMMAFWSILTSDEDEDGRLVYEKIPEYKRETQFIVMPGGVKIGDGELKIDKWGESYVEKYSIEDDEVGVGIPVGWGLNVPYNVGRLGTELLLSKVLDREITTPVDAAVDLTGVFVSSFSPMGIANTEAHGFEGLTKVVSRTITPTFAMPYMEIAQNENVWGAPISIEQFPGDYSPVSGLKKKRDMDWVANIAKGLNEKTGGNDFYRGWGDVSPSEIQHIIDYYTGGIGRTVRRSGKIAQALHDGTYEYVIDAPEIPIKRRQTAQPFPYMDVQAYHDNVTDVKAKTNAYKNLFADIDNPNNQKVAAEWYKKHQNVIHLSNPFGEEKYPLKETQKFLNLIKEDIKYNEDFMKGIDINTYLMQNESLEFDQLSEMKKFNKLYWEAEKLDKKNQK